MREEKVGVIALQETRTIDEAKLQKMGQKAGYNLIGAIHPKQNRVATYLKACVSNSQDEV